MTTHFRSIDSASVRVVEPALFRLTTSPAIGARERKVDDVLADSFPASDPPPWTLGRAPASPVDSTDVESADTTRDNAPAWSSLTTVVVAGGQKTARQWLATVVGGVAAAMMIPLGILLIGIPIAVATRTLIEVAAWVAAVVFN
jgi:hypothetical protein